ncbi:hypothetical protein BAE44_0019704 [Dichanthelium oligosanthes]|uniref:Uncharacterized protein n=1 Tax=Dichanthelium oligosanthes TaxID=888268 RepID=A0A1E5V2J6_9POAL|nr:hypothetical protein BAE44_0019704 [Dichanthelium oligosanthes]
MDISNTFRPALDRITSSIASTASYGFTRVLSFTGSFNDRTSLLHDAELVGPEQAEDEPAPPPRAPEAAPASVTAVAHTFDIEAATPLVPSAGEGQGQEPAAQQDAESRRVAKLVQTVCLFAASASLVLFVNLPSRDVPSKPADADAAAAAAEHRPSAALYSADLVFISLGFFSSLGLSMFSIVARPGDAAVATVQKWGMMVAVASVLVAFTLRMGMMPVT